MNTFPFETWDEAGEAAGEGLGFFTFGPGFNASTMILVAIAIAVMVVAFVGWVVVEDRKLREQAERLRSTGGGPEGGVSDAG